MSGIVTVTITSKDSEMEIRLKEIYSGEYGSSIWPSARVLATLILANKELFQSQQILELGCGVGLPGIVCARLGSSVVLSDRRDPEEVLKNCEYNCTLNGVDEQTKRNLDWGSFDSSLSTLPSIDILLGADLFYENQVLDDFLCTLTYFHHRNSALKYLFVFPERLCVDNIEASFQRWGELIDVVPLYNENAMQHMMYCIKSKGWEIEV